MRMTHPRRFVPLRHVLLTLLVWLGVATASGAQTLDELFDDSRLHDVHLQISERDWDVMTESSDEDTYYPADLRWNGIRVRNVGVRHRGFGSRTSSKPNLRVDMNRYVSGQDFLGLRAVVLDNLYSDASMVREAVAMKVYTRMGIPAPRQAHIRLFVNDVFSGVYLITEAVDRTFVGRAFGEAEADLERGGVLHEYRWLDEYYYDYLGPSLAPYAAMFKAQTRDTDSIARLYGPMEQLIRTIAAVPIERFQSDVGRLLDLPALMRFIGTQNCLAERDGVIGYWGANNFYIYRFRDGRPAVLVPWDVDNSFSFAEIPLDYMHSQHLLMRRAMQVPDLRRQYVLAVSECTGLIEQGAPGDGRSWLEREITRLAAKIRADVARDRFALFHPEEFETEIAKMAALARTRPAYLRCQVATATDRSLVAGGCRAP